MLRPGSQTAFVQPCGFTLRSVEAGYCASFAAGRIGRRSSSPPQLGQRPASTPSAQLRQKVHSNEQTHASSESGGSALAQCSQMGRSASASMVSNSSSVRFYLRRMASLEVGMVVQ